jgi:hypothetical protein
MKYKSKSDGLYDFILLVYLVFTGVMFWMDWKKDGMIMWGVQIFISLMSLVLLWMYFSMSYIIDKKYLIYRSGFIHGKIPIGKIHKIIKGDTVYTGFRIARARKGLRILYNRFDEIYISPENEETFIEELLRNNDSITVENHL